MAQTVKNLPARRPGLDPWVRKIPWRRKWLPTPVFLPGEFHGPGSLADYSPWSCRESDMTLMIIFIIIFHYDNLNFFKLLFPLY